MNRVRTRPDRGLAGFRSAGIGLVFFLVTNVPAARNRDAAGAGRIERAVTPG